MANRDALTRVNTTFTVRERRRIEKLAADAGVPLSAYVRAVFLYGQRMIDEGQADVERKDDGDDG